MAEALIISRFFHFAAAMLLFGTSTFLEVLAPAGLRASLERVLQRPMLILTLLVVATALLWLCLEAGEAGNGWSDTINPDTLESVLMDTAFGQVWIWRLGLIVVLLVGALLLPPDSRLKATTLLSALVLGSLGFVGHAAMQEGIWGWVHRGNQILHLLAAGFWIGGLPPLLLVLQQLRQPDLRRDAGLALRRFSGLGHFAVAIVLATGVINTALILGRPPLDFASPYQSLLAIKIGLVGLMVLTAVFNRYVAVPRLKDSNSQALRMIAAGTIAEIAVGALVIALVSAFATFDPV